MKIILYHSHIAQVGGCETFLYILSKKLYQYYDILVLYSTGDAKQIQRLSEVVNVQKYDSNKQYSCDICIRNSAWGNEPNNIFANRYIQMVHGAYKSINYKYKKWNKTTEHVACGENVKKEFIEAGYGEDITTIHNLLDDIRPVNKILHFISAGRLSPDKGWNRMQKMMQMLRNAKIKFVWTIITDTEIKNTKEYEEIRVMSPRFDIFDYLADADYGVLLSNAEGYPYFINECLQYKTPVICTDFPAMHESVQDGINGYIVPMNMDFDITRILKIPKFDEFKNDTTTETWTKFLGGAKYIKRRLTAMVEIKAIKEYRDLELDNKLIKGGDIYTVTRTRANEIIAKGYAEFVRDIEDATEEEVKEEVAEEKQIETADRKINTEKAIKPNNKKHAKK